MFTQWAYGYHRSIRVALFGSLLCCLLLTLGCSRTWVSGRVVAVHVEEPMDDFDYLVEYGEWIEAVEFGLVWRPYVVDGWRPYMHGRWVWAEDGWTWISYEPYGWLVFHYGDWRYHPRLGWIWVRGSVWHPGLVVWVVYGDYICWAPHGFHRGPGWDPWDDPHWRHWNVIRRKDMDKHDLHKRYIKRLRAPDKIKDKIIRDAPAGLNDGKYPRSYRPTIVKGKKAITGVYTEPDRKKPGAVKKKETPIDGVKLKRVVLPKSESKKVEAQRKKVTKSVLKPKPSKKESKKTKSKSESKKKKKG
jgi:hypothetical protein